MNNNRHCPICRSLLTSSNCRKCGYQQKKLKIVEAQEEFGKLNFVSRVQRGPASHKVTRRLTSDERLRLYLRQYIRLLKSAAVRTAVTYGLPTELQQRLIDTVFLIWKGFLLRRQELGLPNAGIFARLLTDRTKPTLVRKKRTAAAQQLHAQKSDKDEDSSQEEQGQAGKGKTAQAAHPPLEQGQSKQEELQTKHKFRSFYIVSVKPLIHESIEQRKTDPRSLTSCQKAFLSYLLAADNVDLEFARGCSHKYLRMLLQLGGRGCGEKSYVKDGEIYSQLKMRNSGSVDKKDDCILLILLIDLLWCFDSQNFHISSSQKLAGLLQLYQQCEGKSEIINTIVESFGKKSTPDSPNLPDITFELIYSIINTASAKVGACLTISEIIAGCGKLEIPPIAIEDETAIEGVNNEQAINPTKIRKSSHLLASLLDLKGEIILNKWCEKWSTKLQLQNSAGQIALVSELIFKQLMLAEPRGDGKGQFMAEGKVVKYHRHFWIEQDIACLAAIVIYLKLATGVTNYPFIVNMPTKEVMQSRTIKDQQMKVLSQLLETKSLLINNKTTNLLKRVAIPDIYYNQMSLVSLSKTISSLSVKDKAYSHHSLNRSSIRFNNMSHLNGLSSNELIGKLTSIKESTIRPQQKKEHQIQLKYQQMLHKQFARQLAEKYKKIRNKKAKQAAGKPMARLNTNILRQMQCILRENDVLVGQGEPVMTEECVLDEPSSNYELMYEYSQENLSLSSRKEQLYLMEALCLNLCTFSQLTYWLSRQQYFLKFFES